MALYPTLVGVLSGGDFVDDVTLDGLWAVVGDLLVPTQYTSGLGTAGTGFTASATVMERAGRHAVLDLQLAVTTLITATSGDITDKTAFTLNSDYRPAVDLNTVYGNGVMDGECTIAAATGIVSLRSANANCAASTTIRIHVDYYLA